MTALNVSETTSPLDAAIEGVQRTELGGVPEPADVNADPFAIPPVEESSAPKPRGRPRNPNGRAAQRAARAASSAAPKASGRVSDPPAPEVRPEYPKIKPAAVAQSIRQLDAIIVKLAGTAPLSPEESAQGGEVFAPVLDHYMPLLAEKGSIWIAPFTWVVLAYGPRAYEVLDRREQQKQFRQQGAAPAPAPIRSDNGGAAGDSGARGFRSESTAVDTGHVKPFETDSD